MKTKILLILVIVAGCLVCLSLWLNSRRSKTVDVTPQRQIKSVALDSVQELQTESVAASEEATALAEHVGGAESQAVSLSLDPAGEVASSGHSQTTNNSVPEVPKDQRKPMNTTSNISATGDGLITEQQARSIAFEAIGQVTYDKDAGISVQREAGRYTVTFPVKQPELQPGEHYRGPSYAAKIIIDEKTGKVLQVKVGS
ncbi:MAG TPA: hypothetical protein PLE77_02050 [Kiritimatiellia bacterium]|nr:hypothetical protein [Kiritimatiellia bacterium]